MFINDIRKEFYNVLIGKRVLVLVNLDVDALCACKIIQHLMQCDHIMHSIAPVSGIDDIRMAYEKYFEQFNYVILINCGGSINLVETINPRDETIFFVIDSHRPIDLYNIYNAHQIRLLMTLEDDEDIPPLEAIYREDEDEEETAGRRLDEAAIERRIEKRQWNENRERVIFDYSEFSYYGSSSAIIMFDLAWKMSKDTNDLLWWAAVGLTDQLIHYKINQTGYTIQAGSLQNHVARLNHRNEDDRIVSVHCLKMTFENDLQLALYRHWSLYESLVRTPYTACKFRLWTKKGEKRLYEFLAELGISLAQSKQRFSSMDMELRKNVKSWIEEKTAKYGLDDLLNGVFVASFGFKHRFTASDFVYTASSILEIGDQDQKTNFTAALDSLSRTNIAVIDRGLDLARKRLTDIFIQVQTLLALNQVISAGAFLYTVISKGSPGSKLYCYPLNLINLCHTVLLAHVTVSRNRKSRDLPLILSAPSIDDDKSLIIGIPPLSENSSKNLFGQAFLQASRMAKIEVANNYLDSYIIEIQSLECSKFFDALIAILNQ